jgi:RNA polymerase sigma-70 factor (ECF subfamily)
VGSKLTQDRILVHRAMSRQKGGATRLVAKYQGLVLSVLNRATKDREQAEDLAQETFLQAFRNLSNLRDVGQFKSWLMKIAQRAFLAYRRSPNAQSQDMTVSADALTGEIPPDRAEEDQLELVMQSQELKNLVQELPEPYRTTLILRFYNDLQLADVAARQSINLPLVKYRVRHGLKLLREKLAAHGVTEADL